MMLLIMATCSDILVYVAQSFHSNDRRMSCKIRSLALMIYVGAIVWNFTNMYMLNLLNIIGSINNGRCCVPSLNINRNHLGQLTYTT